MNRTCIMAAIGILAILLSLNCDPRHFPFRKDEMISLPDMDFDPDKFGENEIINEHPLSTEEVLQLQVEEIDELENRSSYPGLQYYMLQEIYSGENGKVRLISRTYEMENYAWLASYDTDNSLVDSKTIFYDELAESASGTTSVIRESKINISEYRLNMETGEDSTKVMSFYINGALKFVW